MAKRLKSSLNSSMFKNTYTKTLVLGMMVLASILGFWFGSKATLRTEYPFLAVATPSMTPTLPVGTLIVVHGVPNGSDIYAAYGNGDIIVFRKPTELNELIVHRAVEKIRKDDVWYIRTKGDNNRDPDNWGHVPPYTNGGYISEKLVIGKVVVWVFGVGNIPLFVRTPTGMLVVVLLILIIMFLEYIPILEGKSKQS